VGIELMGAEETSKSLIERAAQRIADARPVEDASSAARSCRIMGAAAQRRGAWARTISCITT
jgi:hypothetical protein